MAIPRIREPFKGTNGIIFGLSIKISLSFFNADAIDSKHINLKMTRTRLENLVEPLIKKTYESCKRPLKNATLFTSDIDGIILVASTSRIPKVHSNR